MKINVAISILSGHPFDWFKVTNQVEQIQNWADLKLKLQARFQPINKTKLARYKLAVWKQVKSVALYSKSFMKIITDIPNISMEEVIDRYMRGLKNHVSRELCTKTYQSLTDLRSDALSVEAPKNSFFKSFDRKLERSGPEPMDISNLKLGFSGQKLTDYENGTCFICHKKNCRVEICPLRKKSAV